ncbi:MAG: YciI family protein [Pseudomonadales bacterium]|nr:YciI family protein [Pseudomonadales bacterium]
MQYVITAHDYQDPQAIDRRMAVRDEHFVGIKKMIENGTFLSGGAILDDSGKMIGSTVHVQFSTRAELDDWIANDPYTLGKVWETVAVVAVKLVPMA